MSEFVQVLDRSVALRQLDDTLPILLMPLRLETRFMEVAGGGHELWLRIFPDDCWIDTFDPALTANEVSNTEAYWTAMAEAGDDVDRQRGAWAALAKAHGSGRAQWLTQTHRALDDDAGELTFPQVETKDTAWSGAPRAPVLPERFVFLGYGSNDAAEPLVQVGSPVVQPLLLGPDPSAPEGQQLTHDAQGNLVVPDELAWLTDFERAVAVGMAMRIPLSTTQAADGFRRVHVVGIRMGSGEGSGKDELETLLLHHAHRRTGIAVLPQGTPTNNTEDVGTGFDRLDDPEQSFDDLRTPLFTPTDNWLDKRDGQWLAQLLGIDETLLEHVHGAGSQDQLAARAMHTALWPATLGYWMETMMAPVFDDATIAATREFFTRHVVGGGAAPAIRIGQQPYGILPATAYSRMEWFKRDGLRNNLRGGSFLAGLHGVLLGMRADFEGLLGGVSHVGGTGDPHQLLLDILGLHPGSVQWDQRYAESLQTLYNRLNLMGFGGWINAFLVAAERVAARQRLSDLGHDGDGDPKILDLAFSGRHNLLGGGVVDDAPLSETTGIRAWTDDGRNYLEWLADAANTSLDALYRQEGFVDGKRPSALLYLMLRHALQLGYSDAGIRLYEVAGLFDPQEVRLARADEPFLHVRDNAEVSESRYRPLYSSALEVTGDVDLPVHHYIGLQLRNFSLDFPLADQLDALQRLKEQPTAVLERVTADHLDLVSYRLDGWLQGMVNLQLCLMRNLRDGSEDEVRQGIHLGGYAWLEDLRPQDKTLTPAQIPDELADVFKDRSPLMTDDTNQGFVHAPSLNHATAAAVLRNGFISNAGQDNTQSLAVNLTSERVRTALGLIEGIRAGQSLSSLLGYQFERGLHDRHALAEVDKFILDLRKAFPLRADKLASTKSDPAEPIEHIEARNVIDGLALVEHMAATGELAYPFGRTGLQVASAAEAAVLDAEADRLREAHDAVADLALSEGVYQAVLGNYDRVASTYDAYARGNFPPEPDVVRTPLSGTGLTHRVGLHLDPSADPDVSPTGGIPMSPRASAEPGLNAWLTQVMPPLSSVGCVASYASASAGASRTLGVTLEDLGLQPADLLVLVRDDAGSTAGGLDDLVTRHVRAVADPRPDTPVTVAYLDPGAADSSVFELLPLVRNLRRLATLSRPLRPTDLTLMNDSTPEQDTTAAVDKGRLERVHVALSALRVDLQTASDALAGGLAGSVDDLVDDAADLLARAGGFGVPQAGWAFVYDFQRRTFAALLGQAAELVTRWGVRHAEFLAKRSAAASAPNEEERLSLLSQAERAISTVPTTPVPDVASYQAVLTAKLAAFEARLGQFAAVGDTARRSVSGLRADIEALLPVTEFDTVEYALTAHDDEIGRFSEDTARVLLRVMADIDARLAAAQDSFDAHDTTTDPAARLAALELAARQLLGEDFRIFPVFPLTAAQASDLTSAHADSASGHLFRHLTGDFPVDEWLYGLARVRDKLFAWEQTVTFAGALGRPEPELVAIQLPHLSDDHWLGLDFPEDKVLDADRLLYTAHHAVPFDADEPQCGLLLDEWTETIPVQSVDTGIAFHFDRPNSEAPQSMLLVTPTQFRGAWQWPDVIDALNETLDLAKVRAVEPRQLDATPYAPFLPATVLASQVHQLTIALDLALNNRVDRMGG